MPTTAGDVARGETRMMTEDRRVRDLSTILNVSRAMTEEKDLDALLALIIREATTLLDADRSSLFLVDEERGELYSRIAEKAGVREIRFPVGRGIAGAVAADRKTINIPDAYNDPRFNPDFDRRTGFHTRSILCMPLLTSDGRLVGVIQVLNKREGPFTRYDEDMLSALGAHAAVALDNARLLEHFVEKKKLEQALSLAREIQHGLFPKEAPSVAGLAVAGYSVSCDETGGDYYDYVDLGNGRIAFAIGDVSGHGVGSALIMAGARAFLRALMLEVDSPARTLERLNRLLKQDVSGGRFVTLFYGVLDTAAGVLRYSSAGHDYPVVYRSATGEVLELESTGPPLGILPGMDFPEGPPLEVKPGDVLAFTTDGVWEAADGAGVKFDRPRLRDAVRRHAAEPPETIIERIVAEVRAHIGDAGQKDDITMIVAKLG
jgi:phosphoserine phosphatase